MVYSCAYVNFYSTIYYKLQFKSNLSISIFRLTYMKQIEMHLSRTIYKMQHLDVLENAVTTFGKSRTCIAVIVR